MTRARGWLRACGVALLLGLAACAVTVGAAGCDDLGTSTTGGCSKNADCLPEHKCVVPAGVCVGFTTPLEAPRDGG